ncbi:MAG: M48 family metalloprotease [Pseudomonadota bacterium]
MTDSSPAGSKVLRNLGVSLACLLLALAVVRGYAAAAERPLKLPQLGDASSALISPELERQIGEDFLKQINASLPTSSDPILKYYVERHIGRLAEYSELTERLQSTMLIDDPQINAFAVPGGVVGINLGLMLYAEDVHEFSSVLAHELAHLSQRHFARGIEEQRAQTLPTLASMLAALVVGAVGGADAGLAALTGAQAVAQANQLRYSRTREQEADRIGLNTLVAAGMDPAAMSRMFERMQRAYRFTRRPPEFLLTHPLTDSRISDARNQASRYPRRQYRDSDEYQFMRARVIVRFADSPQAAVKRFRQELSRNPENEVARYALAVALSAAGEHAEAVAIGDAQHSADPDSLLLLASYAQLLINANQPDQARRLLAHQLVLNPDNAPLSMLYAQALSDSGETQQAQAVLTRQSRARPADVDIWYNLAEVAGLAGDIVAVHLARAEYFALHGGYQKAIQHLEYARRLVDRRNDEQLSRVDQRIIDLRTRLRELRS